MNEGKLLLHPAQRDVYIEQIIGIDSPQYTIGGYIPFKPPIYNQSCREANHSSQALLNIFKSSVKTETAGGKGHFDHRFKKFKLSSVNFTCYHIPRFFHALLKIKPFRKFPDLAKWPPDLPANKQSCLTRIIEKISAQ